MPRVPPGMEWVVSSLYSHRDKLVRGGLKRLAVTRAQVGEVPGGTDRTYAACSENGKMIILSPDLAVLESHFVNGIVLHELGHAVDFLYPAQLHLGTAGDLVVYEHKPWAGDMRAWKRRSHDVVERFADQVAERAFGVTIGYKGPCLLQTTRGGIRPRPAGLL